MSALESEPEAPALDLLHPFTTAQAVAAGIPPSRLRGKAFRRLAKGKYVSATRKPSALLDAEAALLGHPPGAFASHGTAAAVYGVPLPHDIWHHVGVTSPSDRRRRHRVHSHVVPASTRVVSVKGIRLAAPAHVFVQLAVRLPLVELVVVGDALVARELCSPEELVAVAEASEEAHAARALRAARFVREGVDSPMESRVRMLLVLAGLPEPVVNHLLRDEHGAVVRRLDMTYVLLRVIVEYDGRQHADSPRQYAHDRDRREELDDGGWRILVVTAEGIYQDPERTLRRVRRLLRSRGATDLPRTFNPEWRVHFPGRTTS